jgi:hypothetical protein
MQAVKNSPVPQFPALGKLGHRFQEGGARPPDSQAQEVKFTGTLMFNFYLNTGNKKYPQLAGLVPRPVQTLYGIVIGQRDCPEPPARRLPDKFIGIQASVGGSGMGVQVYHAGSMNDKPAK